MRESFQLSKTNVSMRRVELTDVDLDIPGPKTGKVVAVEWQVIYTKGGKETVHRAFNTEAEADASMDRIKAEAYAGRSKATFIEKEQDQKNDSIRYWFSVDGEEYAVVESGPQSSIIGKDGDDVYDRALETKLRAILIVTDEMRAE